jgi:hypothetical protein
MATSKGYQRREYQNQLWNGYQRREEKEDVQEKRGWSSTSSHDSKKFGTRSMEKQGGMAFGFRKTATAVIKLGR